MAGLVGCLERNVKCRYWKQSPLRKVTLQIRTSPAQLFQTFCFPAPSLKQRKCMLLYSILLFILHSLFSFPPLPSASSNDSHAPPPPCVSYVFAPSPPTPPSLLSFPLIPQHSLTSSIRLQNTLQVTFKKIDLFLHSLHPSKPPPPPPPSATHLLLLCVFSPSHLSIGPYSQSLTETAQKLNWVVVWNRVAVDLQEGTHY